MEGDGVLSPKSFHNIDEITRVFLISAFLESKLLMHEMFQQSWQKTMACVCVCDVQSEQVR